MVVTVALVATALFVVYRAMVPRGGTGLAKDFPSSIGYVLADALSERIGSGGIVVVVGAKPGAEQMERSSYGTAQIAGVKAALKNHPNVAIMAEVDLPPPMMAGPPGQVEFVTPQDIAQIINDYPDAGGILLLAGLPSVIPRIGNDPPPIIAFDPSIRNFEGWIRSKSAVVVGTFNITGTPIPPVGKVANEAEPFYKEDGILVTPENIDSLGSISAGPPPR